MIHEPLALYRFYLAIADHHFVIMAMKRKNLSIETKIKLLADVNKKVLSKKDMAAKYTPQHAINDSKEQKQDRVFVFMRLAA